MIILINILVLAVLTVAIWFLTGFEKTFSGESLRDHHFARMLRTGVVMFLIAFGLIIAEDRQSGYIGVGYLLVVPMGIAVLLRGCITEIFAGAFLRMADPMMSDKGPFDPKKSQRYMDTVAHLARTGQRDQAIKLCEEFKRTGEVDQTTVDNMLEFLGVQQDHSRVRDPIAQARQLRAEGRFAEAEQSLRAMFVKKPDNFEAALLLIRIYMENLQQPAKAQEILTQLEAQRHISPALLDIARNTIQQGCPPLDAAAEAAHPKTVEEALARGGVGTAIAMLEEQIKQDPKDFSVRLQLMELQAKRCNNIPRAEKILKELENSSLFTPQQTGEARAQLRQWREDPGK